MAALHMGHLCLKGVDGSIIGEAGVVPQGYCTGLGGTMGGRRGGGVAYFMLIHSAIQISQYL